MKIKIDNVEEEELSPKNKQQRPQQQNKKNSDEISDDEFSDTTVSLNPIVVKIIAGIAFILVVVIVFVIFRNMQYFKNKADGTSTEHTITISGQSITPDDSLTGNPAEDVVLEETDVAALIEENKALKEKVQQLTSSTDTAQQDTVLNMPDTVTAITEYDSNIADILQSSSTPTKVEPLPYKKLYKDFGEYVSCNLLVNYGNAKILVPVNYSDFIKLKDNGVTFFIVETVLTKEAADATKREVVSNVAIDPEWNDKINNIQQ